MPVYMPKYFLSIRFLVNILMISSTICFYSTFSSSGMHRVLPGSVILELLKKGWSNSNFNITVIVKTPLRFYTPFPYANVHKLNQFRKRFSDSTTLSSSNDRATLPRTKSVTTPCRKISASVFEASGLRSAILSTTEDGGSSFLTPNDALEWKSPTGLKSAGSLNVASQGKTQTMLEKKLLISLLTFTLKIGIKYLFKKYFALCKIVWLWHLHNQIIISLISTEHFYLKILCTQIFLWINFQMVLNHQRPPDHRLESLILKQLLKLQTLSLEVSIPSLLFLVFIFFQLGLEYRAVNLLWYKKFY